MLGDHQVTDASSATAAIEPWPLEAFRAAGNTSARLSLAQLEHLAGFGLLAPTTHNTVPERFVFVEAEGAIELWLDRAAVLAASDPTGRQAVISLGCVLTNMLRAAAAYGIAAKAVLDTPPLADVTPYAGAGPRHTRVARLSFDAESTGPAEPRLLEAIVHRKSVRAAYDERVELGAELRSEIGARVMADYPALELHWLHTRAALLALGKLQELADTTALNRPDFCAELAAWLLEDDAPSSVGMRGREYGLSPGVVRHIRAGLLERGRLLPDELAMMARSGGIWLRQSSAACVLVAPVDDVEHWVLAGRAFEDIALALHRHGFVTAVHASLVEVHPQTMALRGQLRTRGRPLVVFRAGQPLDPADGARPRSARPPLSSVTLPSAAVGADPEAASAAV